MFVRTSEAHSSIDPNEIALDAIYVFASDFSQLNRAFFSDEYWDVHRRLELSGKLTHSRAQCPERAGPPLVHAWDAQQGWHEMRSMQH